VAADCVPPLPALLRPIDQDVGNRIAFLAPGSETDDRAIPNDLSGRQLADFSQPDPFVRDHLRPPSKQIAFFRGYASPSYFPAQK
jgi:hypothetical protein